MLTLILIVAACLLSATSCKKTNVVPDDPGEGASGDASPAPQWLAWTETEAAHRTIRVREGDDGLEMVEETEALLVATRTPTAVWEWKVVEEPRQMMDCACQMEKMQGDPEDTMDCTVERPLEIAVLEDSQSGRQLRSRPPTPEQSEIESDYRAEGSVGPFLFTTRCDHVYACGAAHGSTMCEPEIWDLAAGEQVALEQFVTDRLPGPEVLDALEDRYPDQAADVAPEDVELVFVRPVWDADGTLRIEQQYAAPTCYACSDGQWDSYSLSVTILREEVPPILMTAAGNPPPQAFWAAHGDVSGWSAASPSPPQ